MINFVWCLNMLQGFLQSAGGGEGGGGGGVKPTEIEYLMILVPVADRSVDFEN